MDNELYQEISTKVDELISEKDHTGLVKLLKCFDEMYYYHSDARNPGIPDAVYDEIVRKHDEIFSEEYGTYASIQGVGAKPVANEDVRKDYKLPYYMGTVRKVLAELVNQKPAPCGVTEWEDDIQERSFARYKNDALTEIKRDITKFKENKNLVFTLEGKADGISALLVFTKKGKKITRDLYTRGSGTKGKKLSRYLTARSKKDRFTGVPSGTNFTDWDNNKIVIRGELVMPYLIWKTKYQAQGYKNPRNIVSGIVNKVEKKRDAEISPSDIHFVGYEILVPRKYTRFEQIQNLGKMGFFTVPVSRSTFKNLTQKNLWELFCEWRSSTPFELDGIVVFMDWKVRPVSDKEVDETAVAYKCNDQQAIVTVIGVSWAPASNGALKPTVFYKNTVLGRMMPDGEIVGAEYVAATAHNAAFIRDNEIGPGSKIRISRQGLTIPTVKEVVESTVADMPDHVAKPKKTGRDDRDYPGHPKYSYVWGDGSSVAGKRRSVFDIFATEEQDETKIRLIEKFFRIPRKESTGMGVKGLAMKTIKKMYEAGYDTLTKAILLIKDDPDTLADVISSEKNAKKFNKELIKVLFENPVDLSQLMGATQFFPNARMRTVRKIVEEYPNILTNPPKKLKAIKGVAGDVLATFLDHLPRFLQFLQDTGIKPEISEEPEAVGDSLTGQNIMFTGKFAAKDPKTGKQFTRTDVQNLAKKYGAKIASGSKITSKVTLLVVGDAAPGGRKEQDAKDKGVPVMSESDFLKQFVDKSEFKFQ
jgi:DNA ligase (NAD+)